MTSLLASLKRKVFLGSQSPRRQQLLSELGLDFSVLTIENLDESYPKRLETREVPTYLSNHKSRMLWDKMPDKNGILITADTIVVVEDDILGKPLDKGHAQEMLKRLSDKTHSVITGVTLKSIHKSISFSVTTLVTFRKLTSEEIDYYIDKYAPFDKAGGYGIQEWIGLVGISKISGSYYNVVGLPVEKLYNELRNF